MTTEVRLKRLWIVAGLISILPISLAMIPGVGFEDDWANTIWRISYYGDYFQKTFRFPVTFDTTLQQGIAFPIFYSTLLEPFLGLISIVLGADLVVRLVLLSLWLGEFALNRRIFSKCFSNQHLAILLSVAFSFSIYPMTNVYSRGALPEAIAYHVLLMSGKFLLLFLLQTRSWLDLCASSWLAALTVGTHTITALYGGAALFPLLVVKLRTKMKWWGPLVVLQAISVLSFMMVATMFQYMLSLKTPPVLQFIPPIDGWINRWNFIPQSIFYLRGSIQCIDAPMDITVIVVVLFGLGVLIKKGRLSFEILYLTGAGIFYYFTSVTQEEFGFKSQLGKLAEFCFRFVGLSNICFHLAAIAAILLLRDVFEKVMLNKKVFALLIICTSLSALGMGLKLYSASHEMNNNSIVLEIDNGVYRHPDFFGSYAHFYDRTLTEWRGKKIEWNSTENRVLEISAPTGVATSVQAFPWNQVYVNGKKVPAERRYRIVERLAFEMSDAGKFTIAWKVEPPSFWNTIRYMSLLVFWTWGLVFLGIILRRSWVGISP